MALAQTATFGQTARNLTPAPAPRVLVFDEAGGGTHTDFQRALDEAENGDLVLLRSDVTNGPSQGFVVRGKGLTLLGERARRRLGGPSSYFCEGSLRIEGVPADAVFVLRNLRFESECPSSFGGPGDVPGALRILDTEGSVWIEDCEVVVPSDGFFFLSPSDDVSGIEIRDAAEVVVQRTVVAGPDALDLQETRLGQALAIRRSTVLAFDSSFLGRNGAPIANGTLFPNADGEDGVHLEDSSLFASGCSIRGGDTGASTQLSCTFWGIGGTGLFALRSTVDAFACQIEGGEVPANSCFGLPGPDTLPVASTVRTATGTPRSLSATSPTRSGATTILCAVGQPNDSLVLIYGLLPEALRLSSSTNALLLTPVAVTPLLGPLASDGTFELPLTVHSPPQRDHMTLFVQGLFLPTAGPAQLSGGTTVTVLP